MRYRIPSSVSLFCLVVALAVGSGATPASAAVRALTTYTNIQGATRYDTAVSASQHLHPEGSPGLRPYPTPDSAEFVKSVVLATGENWPDALGGAAVASRSRSPILLTKRTSTPASVLAEIERLDVDNVIILGGTAAISEEVEQALAESYTVERIAGKDRYATARACAIRSRVGGFLDYKGSALVATGLDYPDALAGSVIGATQQTPLFLVGRDGIDDATLELMKTMVGQDIMILGGTNAVSTEVEDVLKTEFGAENVRRFAGANRYATARLVAEHACAEHQVTWDGLGIATGESFPDALAGGVMCGHLDAPILLTKSQSLSADTEAALRSHGALINEVHFFGGTSAIANEVRETAKGLLE